MYEVHKSTDAYSKIGHTRLLYLLSLTLIGQDDGFHCKEHLTHVALLVIKWFKLNHAVLVYICRFSTVDLSFQAY